MHICLPLPSSRKNGTTFRQLEILFANPRCLSEGIFPSPRQPAFWRSFNAYTCAKIEPREATKYFHN